MQLVTPPESAGVLADIGRYDETAALLLPPQLDGADFEPPDLVVGHGHVTGPHALVLAQHHFPRSRLMHVVHTVPSHLAPYKRLQDEVPDVDGREHAEVAIIEKSHVVLGIGPVLRTYAESLARRQVLRLKPPPIYEFVPHIASPEVSHSGPPQLPVVTLIGRLDDVEIKGLPRLIDAMAKVGEQWRREDVVELRLRGVPSDSQRLVDDWRDWNQRVGSRVRINQLPYSSKPATLRGDLVSSTVVVMPSPEEGFGLVALEALSMGIPILVGGRSGIADWLRNIVPEEFRDSADKLIVPVNGSAEAQDGAWADAILSVLENPPRAFERSLSVYRGIVASGKWTENEACRLIDEVLRRPADSEAEVNPGHKRSPGSSSAQKLPESELKSLATAKPRVRRRWSLADLGRATRGALLVYLAGGNAGDRFADGRLIVGPGQMTDDIIYSNMQGFWQLGKLRESWAEEPSLSPQTLIAAYGRPRDRRILASVPIDTEAWGDPELHEAKGLFRVPTSAADGLDFHGLRDDLLDEGARFGPFSWQLFLWVDGDGIVKHPVVRNLR